MTRYIAKVAEISGVKTGLAAMVACGMQPEFAAHMMQQNQSLDISLILRAGSPPVYNQRRGPKTGFNLTKTSNQGFFRGSLAADVKFTRICEPDDKHPNKYLAGHKDKDATHLGYSIKKPDYQHTIALPVTMQDILREVGPSGDLTVLGYDEGRQLLTFAYREGLGSPEFNGQFVIDLSKGDSTPTFYSRPWDKPSHSENWDPEKRVITKPAGLEMFPDEVYERVFNQTFTLGYVDDKKPILDVREVKEAKCFANTPRTSLDLLRAIKASGVIPEESEAARKLAVMDEGTSREEILQVLSEEEIKAVYDKVGLVTTGDWDGLALGISTKLTAGFPEGKMRVYNTFDLKNAQTEMDGLLDASIDYFMHLKELPQLEGTDIKQLLDSVLDPSVLFSEFALARAGCITPHEFLYQQLINYSYRNEVNDVYGNVQGREYIQNALDAGLAQANEHEYASFEEMLADCTETALSTYRSAVTGAYSPSWHAIDEEHLINHLKVALSHPTQSYTVPNISHDHNVHDLYQHGFDVRNPYGVSEDGPWLMITNLGAVVYGSNQDQLIQAILVEDFLKDNIITVPSGYDMAAGWGKVVQAQLVLRSQGIEQDISERTIEKYNEWRGAQRRSSLEMFKEFSGRFSGLFSSDSEASKENQDVQNNSRPH